MINTHADAEQWHHFHRRCFAEGVFRSFDEAEFVVNVHGGHGPSCLQYLSASAYISGSGDVADHD